MADLWLVDLELDLELFVNLLGIPVEVVDVLSDELLVVVLIRNELSHAVDQNLLVVLIDLLVEHFLVVALGLQELLDCSFVLVKLRQTSFVIMIILTFI